MQRSSAETGFSAMSRLGILFGIFFIMLMVMGVIQPIVNSAGFDRRTSLLVGNGLQCLLVFIIPALVTVRIGCVHPFAEAGLAKNPGWRPFAGVIIVFFLGLPALNQLIFWNESIALPESMQGIEQTMRGLEEDAGETTEIILNTQSFGGMVCGVLVIGFLTALGEELFFRGSIQRILQEDVPVGASVWITAFLFSAMHFQFYGFFPRLLLGAFFGYLVVMTGSLWVSIFAHAFNNSLVVVTAWIITNGWGDGQIDQWGVSESGFPIWAFSSMVATTLFFIFFRKYFFLSKSN